MEIILGVVVVVLASAIIGVFRNRARWLLLEKNTTPLLGVVMPLEEEDKK
jgi:hypothetical protein